MKLLHIGLCANNSSITKAFKYVLSGDNYRELYCFQPNINEHCIEVFNEFKPDVVFAQIQNPNVIENQIFDYMKSNGAFVINWTGDKRNFIPQWMLDAAPFVSLTAFSNQHDVNEMRKLGYLSEYLEIGYDEEIYTPIGEKKGNHDVVFMGNNYGENFFPMSTFRKSMCEYLKYSFDNFAIYGANWLNASGNFNHSQHEEACIYRGSKIAVNCSHFDVERYNSDRLLRILGTGTFCLSYKHKGMEQDYENYKHLVYFESLSDLKNKIDYYLAHPIERQQIAYEGQQLVLNRNTFKHQVENIIKLVK